MSLTTSLFVPTLKFLQTDCWSSLNGPSPRSTKTSQQGVMEMETFLKILGSMFDRTLIRETLERAAEAKNRQIDVTPVHALSTLWG